MHWSKSSGSIEANYWVSCGHVLTFREREGAEPWIFSWILFHHFTYSNNKLNQGHHRKSHFSGAAENLIASPRSSADSSSASAPFASGTRGSSGRNCTSGSISSRPLPSSSEPFAAAFSCCSPDSPPWTNSAPSPVESVRRVVFMFSRLWPTDWFASLGGRGSRGIHSIVTTERCVEP